MPEMQYYPLFELTRGPLVESIHFGAVTVVDNSGRLVAWYGDPEAVTLLRSSAKPFQALPFIERGGQAAFGLTPREVALICASHSGTDEHLAVVRNIQAKTGVQETDLLCGIHPLSHAPTVDGMLARGEENSPNRNNCSGKHTGMLACILLRKLKGEILPEGIPYTDPAHPHQKEILQTFAEMCGLSTDQVAVGVDGCSVPTFGVSLRAAALAYARLCDPGGLPAQRAEACRAITASMTAHPFMVGGHESFDTALMETTGGRIVSKGGAEGYQALGLMPGALRPGSPALGITLKISDGDLGRHTSPRRGFKGTARPAVALEVLRQLGALSASELAALSSFGPSFQIHNHREIETGIGKPCFNLQRS
jgi:L-asparaginase II